MSSTLGSPSWPPRRRPTATYSCRPCAALQGRMRGPFSGGPPTARATGGGVWMNLTGAPAAVDAAPSAALEGDRAVGELRRGLPGVLLAGDGAPPLLMQAVDGATEG